LSKIELSITAKAYREIQAEIRELENQAAALRQLMIDALDMQQIDETRAGEYTIRYNVYESSRFDSAKLKAEQPDIYESYTKRMAATRFTVS
jgi:predicted phage-related endonuclease